MRSRIGAPCWLLTHSLGQHVRISPSAVGIFPWAVISSCTARRNAYRAVYAVQVGEDVWVVHAVQKKSTQGIKTPRREIDLTRARLKRLQEMLP